MNTIRIIQELRKARGSNAKKKILKQHIENSIWKRFLLATYNPMVTYGVSPAVDFTFDNDVEIDEQFFSILDNLEFRVHEGSEARFVAKKLSKKYGELGRIVLARNINAGLSTKTINSIYRGLIPSFNVMLAENDTVTEFPCYASVKYDGVRLIAFVDLNRNVELRTRAGHKVVINSLEAALRRYPDNVFDGELVYGTGKQVTRTKITGEVNRCLKGTATDIRGCQYHIFDSMPMVDWDAQYTNFFSDRQNILKELLGDSIDPILHLVEQRKITNSCDLQRFYSAAIANGYEGLIVRYGYHFYEWKRTHNLIKQKATESTELYCTEVIPGKGKYEGLIGSLVCNGFIDGKDIYVNIGTGFSDADRERNKAEYIGKVIDVEYNSIIQAEGYDTYSLFLPVFKRIRGDYSC